MAQPTKGAFRALGNALGEVSAADKLRRRDSLALQRQNGELEARLERLEDLLSGLTTPDQIIHAWGLVSSDGAGNAWLVQGHNVAAVRIEPVQGRFEIYFLEPLGTGDWAGYTSWHKNTAVWGYFGAESSTGFRLTPASANAGGAFNINVNTVASDLSFAIVGTRGTQ